MLGCFSGNHFQRVPTREVKREIRFGESWYAKFILENLDIWKFTLDYPDTRNPLQRVLTRKIQFGES